MTTRQWAQVEGLFHAALPLTPEARETYLADCCGDDRELRCEVESLLAADGGASDSLDPSSPPRLSRYKFFELVGSGGMGSVYRAQDLSTGEIVAVKVFPPFLFPEQRRRLLKESEALARLRHPNIVRVREIAQAGSRDCLVMDFIPGATLAHSVPAAGLPILTAVRYARMLAAGLSAAHEAGIVHRDLKPANVIVDPSGSLTLVDFGLAKLADLSAEPSVQTEPGLIVGTAAYLSPEQAQGQPVDARADLFSFGALFYEMLTGHKAFEKESLAATLSAILRDQPTPLRNAPPAVVRVVSRCLQKEPGQRYASARDLLHALESCEAALTQPPSRLRRIARPLLALLLLAIAGLAYFGVHQYQTHWARSSVEPRIASLLEHRLFNSADELVHQIESIVPADPAVRDFERDYRMVSSIATTPPEAEVAIKDYNALDAPWRVLGKSPLKSLHLPIGYLRWRVSAPGYRTREFAETVVLQPVISFSLETEKAAIPGMLPIPAGRTAGARSVQVPAFWLDQFEVTNRQYQEFVNAHGYRRRELWREPIVKDGHTLAWDEAMPLLIDQTGSPGPANWQLGAYPEGQADLPVTGVSWYEAAAYAEFRGKSLPVHAQWLRAGHTELFYADSVLASNFSGKGLAPVGSFHSLDRFGTFDLTGNCKEWAWNEYREGSRLALGGAWDDGYWAAASLDAAPPFSRRANIGFRCAKNQSALRPELTASPARPSIRDYTTEKSAADADFVKMLPLFNYPAKPLNARIDAVDETSPYWIKQTVSFDVTYAPERMSAYLFLPRRGKAPYQTVAYFPSGIALAEKSSSSLEMWFLEPLIRQGRAVLYPVLWGTYERKRKAPDRSAPLIRETQDMRRSLDYLATRPDIDQTKLAYFGYSAGANFSPLVLASEPRFKAAVLALAGLVQAKPPPEVDPFNFAPRVRVPVLILNGRYDLVYPLETSQRPFLNALGTPAADKKMVLLEAGHALVCFPPTTKESLAWLDKYLGKISE